MPTLQPNGSSSRTRILIPKTLHEQAEKVLLMVTAVCGFRSATKPPTPSASGKGLLYVAPGRHTVIVIDEASEKVVDRIDLKTDVR